MDYLIVTDATLRLLELDEDQVSLTSSEDADDVPDQDNQPERNLLPLPESDFLEALRGEVEEQKLGAFAARYW